ncbi:MAG: glycoside hydrolase family 31 protein [Bacteroidales bacterium]|nr:glycoside hydrolase family 31 protein [Bacteroidales bacterium]
MNHAYSQSSQNRSLGRIKTQKLSGQTLSIDTEFGKAEITVFGEGIFRMRIVKDAFQEDFSYAVSGKPEICEVKLQESNEKLTLSTAKLKLEINRNPVRFAFYTPDGKLINTDDQAFGTSWIGTEVTTYKQLQPGERFIGLGEKTGNLDRSGSAYDNWNTDNPRYGPNDDPLYVTIPFYMGLHNGLVYGIFMDNTHRSRFNFGASNNRFSSFSADDGEMDYYFIHETDVAGIIQDYTQLTGRMTMPPLWALGYQQCRWSYFPDTEVLNVVKNFRDRKIPLDVIYLDIHYMDAYKIFTWHPTRFSNPQKLLSDLKSMGVHTTVIVDPGIKVEKGYAAYEDGLKKDMFIKYPDGQVYTAQVWPGWCHFPDFTKPAAREWWGNNFSGLVASGVEGFWNDMNEIASWGGGYTPHLVELDWEGKKTAYRQAKNVYGMQMARSTYEGTRKLMNNQRPLILTRAGYAGLQRYTALWTGDNQASEEHMMLGTRLLNSLGLSGVSFTGVDVGGFSKDATPSLFARWIGVGAFSPFFRSHTHYDTKSAEPWAYGETVENISRNYIQLRYKLLPYIYSAFHESVETGMPVNRSLAINYTFDEKIYHYIYQNQYLFGPSIMVAPTESTRDLVKVYLPEGEWYDLHSGVKHQGNSEITAECPVHILPLFIKAGSVIPMQKGVQSTSEDAGDVLYLHIFNGNSGSDFVYYEDDGSSYNYEKGAFYRRMITFDPEKKQLKLHAKEGSYNSHFRKVQLILHGFPENSAFRLNNGNLAFSKGEIDLFNALEPADPQYLETKHNKINILSSETTMGDGEIVLSW